MTGEEDDTSFDLRIEAGDRFGVLAAVWGLSRLGWINLRGDVRLCEKITRQKSFIAHDKKRTICFEVTAAIKSYAWEFQSGSIFLAPC